MKKLNQKGFTGFEIALLVLVLVLIGFAGYTVWQNNKSDSPPATTVVTQKEDDKASDEPATVDPTIDWVAYKNIPGKFELKHPKTWVKAINPELCSENLLLIAANESSVGKCATESFGQMAVSGSQGDTDCSLPAASYTVNSEADAMASSINGKKYVGTAKDPVEGMGLPAGTKVTQYCFKKSDTTYTATYVHSASAPDVLSDFDLMVTKTLKFN